MNVALRNLLMDQYNQPIQISANGLLANGDVVEKLKFAFAVAPLRTARAFRTVGIDIKNPHDLATIANLYTTGADKRGVRMADQKVYAYDTAKIVEKILRDREPSAEYLLANAPIEWVP